MKRRGFLKYLAAAPVALAVKPPKKKKYVHRAPSPKISNKDIIDRHYEIIDKMQERAVAEIQAEEDRYFFSHVIPLMKKAAQC